MINQETLRLKIRNVIYLPLTKDYRNKKLIDENFTIISNNCWGGTVYESYGIQKKSPTVGMFIMPEDYLKFIYNLDYYLKQRLEFIFPCDSKWKEVLGKKNNWNTYLIAKLDDIELHMLHYHNQEIASQKWSSRVERINKEKLIFKFNDQNFATVDQIETFMRFPFKNKLCFVADEGYKVTKEVILIKQPFKYHQMGIMASREPIGHSKYIDITDYINSI